MKFKVFIGVDVSKEWLDFAVYADGEILFKQQQKNTQQGIIAFCEALKNLLNNSSTAHWLFCMEHTGLYCNPLLKYVIEEQLALWLENATTIKAFHGLARGKNDALDACRIAEYAGVKSNKARLWQAPRKVVIKLKSLLKLRERLVTSKKRLKDALGEDEQFADKEWVKTHEKLVKPAVKKIDKQIKEVEKKILEIIRSDDELNRLFRLMKSVTGVGEIVASNTLVVTNEFKEISDPKKMACHCGVAPFSHNSGKSIRGKAKVSHRANKNMKALLHLAAMAAIPTEGELRDYYYRKLEQGKNKMAVINAVRNKIIHRIFAVVREGRKYEKSYTHTLA
jgi:transposase